MLASSQLHIALSYVDAAGARNNFAAERTTWKKLRRRGRARWDEALGTVRADHPTTQQKAVFDTALYHMMVAPYVHSDADHRFRGPDGGVHIASWRGRPFTFYTFLSTWDTYRAWGPLMCRLRPRMMLDLVRTSLLHHAIVGVLPRWTYAGQETGCMPGIHSITLMWQAVAHGLTSPELDRQILTAFEHTVNGSSTFPTGYRHKRVNHELREIVKNDGILFDGEGSQQTVSEALEYAIIMRCIGNMVSRVAGRRSGGAAGEDERSAEIARYERLSKVYQRLWDNSTGYFGGFARKQVAGPAGDKMTIISRVHETAPLHATTDGLWTEGCALQWMFHVMHDFAGLESLVGRSLMRRRLQLLFEATCTSELPDTTGLIGCYAHGNEPSHHVIFWFFLLGQRATAYTYLDKESDCSPPTTRRSNPPCWRARLSHPMSYLLLSAKLPADDSSWSQVIRMYTNAPDGLPGNEDAGQMSAWLVATMLGFYPVDPTSSRMLAFQPWVTPRGKTKRLACAMGCLNMEQAIPRASG